jgi:eukaryotic-like serine/threonine-protein kinase
MLHCPTCGKHYPPEVKFCPADQAALQADVTIMGDTPVDPLIGQVLDEKYKLEERLGIGGMGTVYRARHLLIDRPVAVKVLNQRFVEDEAARTRFHREARAAGRLQHLNAVAVTDYGQTTSGYVYIVMELLEGRTLRDILAKEAPLETARAVSLMLQIAAAVAAAHEAGIIHRDLKPANIFVTQSADVPAVVKVLDFGIAKLAEEHLDEEEPKALTQVGAMIGTPRYMSPEQCSGLDLTPAADVYSLGVILYEMLTGMVPFSGSSPLAIALKHAKEAPRAPTEIVASIPEEIEHVAMHALEKQPSDRPGNAAEFRTELLEIAEKLNLEHHALVTTPDLDALRTAGVQSPSGRLVVDLSRLREGKVLTSGSSELTVVGAALPKQANVTTTATKRIEERAPFPRVNVAVGRKAPFIRYALIAVVAIIATLLGVALIAPRLRNDQAAPAVLNANVSPSPVASPSPTPSPSPSPSPKRQGGKDDPNKKKPGKVNSIVNKVKRILKKPF